MSATVRLKPSADGLFSLLYNGLLLTAFHDQEFTADKEIPILLLALRGNVSGN